MPHSVIVAAASIRDYFREAVSAALQHQAFFPDEATSSYLVDLLCDRAHVAAQEPGEALALTLAKAEQTSPGELVRQLKLVGDQSLYLAGYFRESLRRSQVDLEYYVVVGGRAYRRLSSVLRRTGRGTPLVVVFTELGQEFLRFAEILNDVRGQGLAGDLDLGDLYQEWLHTGSAAVERRLRAAGVLAVKGPRSKQ